MNKIRKVFIWLNLIKRTPEEQFIQLLSKSHVLIHTYPYAVCLTSCDDHQYWDICYDTRKKTYIACDFWKIFTKEYNMTNEQRDKFFMFILNKYFNIKTTQVETYKNFEYLILT